MVTSGDAKVPAEKKENMKKVLSTLNSFLEAGDWIAGENPTIADFSVLSNIVVILVRDSEKWTMNFNSNLIFRVRASTLMNIPIYNSGLSAAKV